MNAATIVDHPLATRVGEVSEALTAQLPSLSGWRTEPVPSSAVSDIQPSNARAISARVEGVGRLVLLASAPLAAGIPGDGQDGLGQLEAALVGAAGAAGFPVGAPAEIGADTALIAGPADTLLAVRLLDGETHMASLVLIVEETVDVVPASFAPAPPSSPSVPGRQALDLLHDVEMAVTVELGRTRMLLRDVLALTVGSVIELDRAAGSLVDLFVNGTLIARGEVVVVDEEFGVRIAEVVGAGENTRGR